MSRPLLQPLPTPTAVTTTPNGNVIPIISDDSNLNAGMMFLLGVAVCLLLALLTSKKKW